MNEQNLLFRDLKVSLMMLFLIMSSRSKNDNKEYYLRYLRAKELIVKERKLNYG